LGLNPSPSSMSLSSDDADTDYSSKIESED